MSHDQGIGWLILGLFVLGCFVGAAIARSVEHEDAVKNNAAHYDERTGAFVWGPARVESTMKEKP